MTDLRMVFDVESIGLHGEAWAVGWIVIDGSSLSRAEGLAVAPRSSAKGDDCDREWVDRNCPELAVTHPSPIELRGFFWAKWREWADQGATLWADCGWPVEANFLEACIQDDPERKWQGPYPLHEISTVFEIAGWNPLEDHPRLYGENKHHPLGDARQSARLLLKAIESIHNQ